jgi:hypothetical protein
LVDGDGDPADGETAQDPDEGDQNTEGET